ncbi:MAG: carbamoyltransferase C-terminal domain-containing protein [Bryobacterales bacterium]
MLILGIGGWLHDGAAAVLVDGRLHAAMEEEKLLRQGHPGGLPRRAIDGCLEMAGAAPKDVDYVSLARPLATGDDASFHLQLKSLFPNSRLVIVDHHMAHAAAAYYPSPFEKARVLTLDRRGDMRCGALWDANGPRLEAVEELYAPDSLAGFYSRITQLLGFRSDSEEHKVQWLSVEGEPRFSDLFLSILGVKRHHRVQVDHSYFDTSRPTGGGFSHKFYAAIGVAPGDELDEKLRADLAASVQSAIEQAAVGMAGEGENLCVGGGLAMNAMVIAALESSGRFENVWVQPAAGNAGTAVGSALHAWHQVLRRSERHPLKNMFLGPDYDSEHIKKVLENCKLRFHYLMTDGELIDTAVKRLADHQIVAWFQGRMEFGPRALGNRSIFASPLNTYSTENLNVYIKHRESFRKFAASVPAELAGEYFETGANARFLATVSRVRKEHRKTFEAALLDEDRIRVHTVHREDNPLCWELLHAAGRVNGLPVLYNTSFNLFGEPLVCDPRAALRSFFASGIDAMFVGRFFLEK